jgi:predicted amidophosphoribosyltransferase
MTNDLKYKLINSIKNILVPVSTHWNSINYLPDKYYLHCNPKYKFINIKKVMQFNSSIFIVSYQDKNLKYLVQKAKYNFEWDIANDFAKLIYRQYIELKNESMKCINNSIIPPDFPNYISYIPQDPIRFLERQFHLPNLIARRLGGLLNVPCLELTQKKHYTKSQTQISNRDERNTNLKNVFEYKKPSCKINNTDVIWIIDDIATTGSTFHYNFETLNKELKSQKFYGICLTTGV